MRNRDMTASDLSRRLSEAKGSRRGHGDGEGRSQSYPSVPPQAGVQRQQDEQVGFPKSTLGLTREQGIRHQCVFQRKR